MKPHRRGAVLVACATLVHGLLMSEGARAEDYPAKPVRVLVAQAPGGASDLLIRVLTRKLADALGQQFVVDNRPGAGGNIGAEIAAKAQPDGYTLFMVSAPHAVAPSLYRRLGYDLLRDFAPVTLIGSEALCMVITPSLQPRTLGEMVAYLKSHPGKVSYGSTGNGAVNHLATELFKSRAGVDMVHVPYKGSAFAIPDIISGVVPVLFANVSPLQPHIRSGRLRPLAVTSRERVNSLPEVPTIAESGYPGYEAVNWFGLVVPGGTPAPLVRRLNAAIQGVLGLPEVRAFYLQRGAVLVFGTPEAMSAFLRSEIAKWAVVVKASGARID